MKSNIKYSKELLEPIVQSSISFAEVIRKLGLKQSGSTQTHIKSRILKYEIDISHFLGSRTNSGKNHKGGPDKLLAAEILVLDKRNGRREKVKLLRRALLEIGVPHQCAICGLGPEWNNKFLQLQIDHINGNGVDNRPENLRFVCGNCHIQTETYGIKNAYKKDDIEKS